VAQLAEDDGGGGPAEGLEGGISTAAFARAAVVAS